jgi:putative acetyltransferase
VIIRREAPGDVQSITDVHAEAFANPESPDVAPAEVKLVDDLRASNCWIPQLSLVLIVDDMVVGHVACTRGWVGDHEALGLGPIGLLRSHQLKGGGSALMHAAVAAAEAMGEPLVALLGSTEYYPRFGFVPAADLEIEAPDVNWGAHFQARSLAAYQRQMTGRFRYAPPFDGV